MRNLPVLAVAALLCGGCVAMMPQGQLVPVTSVDTEFDVERSRSEVFEALLSVAQTLNLSVDVLEKDSGFIQFKNSALSPTQLDRYCKYPYVKAGSDTSWDTFQNWNQRSVAGGVGSVSGTLSLNAVLSETASGTHAKLHSTFVASNRNETNECSSTGVLERDFEQALRNKLGLTNPSTPSGAPNTGPRGPRGSTLVVNLRATGAPVDILPALSGKALGQSSGLLSPL